MPKKTSRKSKSKKRWFPIILFDRLREKIYPQDRKIFLQDMSTHEAISEIDELLKASIVTYNRTEQLKQDVKRDFNLHTG